MAAKKMVPLQPGPLTKSIMAGAYNPIAGDLPGPDAPLIRVLEIYPSDGNFRFSGGQPLPFVEVDWFHDASTLGSNPGPGIQTEEGRKSLEAFIRAKPYFNRDTAYLVLSGLGCFTINYAGG